MPSVVARSVRPQSIIWLDVHSVSLSPFHDAMEANGSIIAWLWSGSCKSCVELDAARGECLLEIAHAIDRRRGTALAAVATLSGAVFECAIEVELPLRAHVIDMDQHRRGARLLECLGHDDRDRLMVVVDVGAAEQLDGVELALAELAAAAELVESSR